MTTENTAPVINQTKAQEAIKKVNVHMYKEAMGITNQPTFKKFYGIKDIKSGRFAEIMEDINDASMIRRLSMAVNKQDSQALISQFPEDFELWKLYEVNEETGETISDLRKITNALDYKQKN